MAPISSDAMNSTSAEVPPRMLFVTQLASIERLTLQFFGMLLLLVLIYSAATAISGKSIAMFFHAIGMILALCLAAAAIGGFLGFLFGIPRLLQRTSTDPVPGPMHAASATTKAAGGGDSVASSRAAVSSRFYGSNTNLEDISDWVTKIIVGLGLVQAKTIFLRLWDAAKYFQTAFPGTAGTDVLFLLVGGAAAVAGFLFFYLETRTRIILLFVDAENAAVAAGRDYSEAASAVRDAPILDLSPSLASDAGGVLPRLAPASKEDSRFLNITLDTLNSADDVAAWASAQARAGNLQAANTAFQQAIARKPHDKDLLIKLAETQALQGRWNDAAQTLTEAEQNKEDDPELLKRDLFVSLYLQPPESFTRAISIAEKLLSDASNASDPNVYLWLAAAQGQRAWYYHDRDPKQYEEARLQALHAARKLIELQPDRNSPHRKVLRGMLDPSREGTPAVDNDLAIFKDDPEFEALLFSR